jgi:hypothetical protein
MVPVVAGWTSRVQGQYARRPTRTGRSVPKRATADQSDGPAGGDARLNLLEHFVHCEDGAPGGPELDAARTARAAAASFVERDLGRGKGLFRRSPVSSR